MRLSTKLTIFLLCILLTSCSTQSLVIHCEPQSLDIYVNGNYIGKGVGSCLIESSMGEVSIICKDNEQIVYERCMSPKSISSPLYIYHHETLQYSDENQTLFTH